MNNTFGFGFPKTSAASEDSFCVVPAYSDPNTIATTATASTTNSAKDPASKVTNTSSSPPPLDLSSMYNKISSLESKVEEATLSSDRANYFTEDIEARLFKLERSASVSAKAAVKVKGEVEMMTKESIKAINRRVTDVLPLALFLTLKDVKAEFRGESSNIEATFFCTKCRTISNTKTCENKAKFKRRADTPAVCPYSAEYMVDVELLSPASSSTITPTSFEAFEGYKLLRSSFLSSYTIPLSILDSYLAVWGFTAPENKDKIVSVLNSKDWGEKRLASHLSFLSGIVFEIVDVDEGDDVLGGKGNYYLRAVEFMKLRINEV